MQAFRFLCDLASDRGRKIFTRYFDGHYYYFSTVIEAVDIQSAIRDFEYIHNVKIHTTEEIHGWGRIGVYDRHDNWLAQFYVEEL